MTAGKKDTEPRVRPKLNRPLRWSIFLLLIILTLVNIYFHFRRTILQRALPYITTQIEKYVEEEMGAHIKWESAGIDAWGRIVFTGLELRKEGETEPTALVKEMTLSVDEKNLIARRADPVGLIRTIIIDGLHVSISRDAEGKLNLSSLFKPGEEPFKLEEFPLKARLKLKHCSVDYTDAQLFKANGGKVRAANIRGGIDLRDISDVQLALILDIKGITTRSVNLKARSNLPENTIDASLAGEIDIHQLTQLINIETHDSEIEGTLSFGLNSTGNFMQGLLGLLPQGTLTFSQCSFANPIFNEAFGDIGGTLHLAFGEGVMGPTGWAHTEGLSFKYGDSAAGTGSARVGWEGELAYAFDLDIAGLKPESIGALLPDYVTGKLGLRGTTDLSLLYLDTDDGPALRAVVTPAPDMQLLGMNFNGGEARVAYQEGRLLLEDISLSSSSGRSFGLNGFLKFGDEPEYRVACAFTNAPVSAASTFYKKAADWPIDGNVSGTLSYTPYNGSHKLDIRAHADSLETEWGEVGATIVSLSSVPGRFSIDGFAAEAFGGWISAVSGEDGHVRFAASGIDGNHLADAFGMREIKAGRFNGKGELTTGKDEFGFEMDLAVADVEWRDLHLTALSGSAGYGPDGISLQDVKATGSAGELIELSGYIQLNGDRAIQLDARLGDFDFGRLMPDHEGAALSRTDGLISISGPFDDLTVEASLTEKSIGILGSNVYTCDPECIYGARTVEGEPPVGEVNIKGKAKIVTGAEGDTSSIFNALEFSELTIKGAVCVGPQQTGLESPAQYRHILKGDYSSDDRRASTGGLNINGVLAIDGRFEGPVAGLTGEVTLSAPSMKFGLQEINDLRIELIAGGLASYTLDGEWKYGSGGKMMLSGPAGWDSEEEAFVVDLGLDIEAAPIKDVLALAGVDVSSLAEGLFDGDGRIYGPAGDIALNEFKINARQGSRLLGMPLQEGRMEFSLSGGILNLTDFQILSNERATGGRCTIGGSGELYLEETGLLPQAQLSANIVDYRLEDLQSVYDGDFPLIGRLDADISIEQEGMRKLVYDVRLSELALKGRPLPALNVVFSINPIYGEVELTRLRIDDGIGGWLDVSGYVSLGTLSALFNEEMRRGLRYEKVNLDITGEDFDLGFLAGSFPEGAEFNGKLELVNLHIEGKPTKPSIDGIIKPSIGPIILGGFVVVDEIATHSGEGLQWEEGSLKTEGDLFIRRGDAIANIIGDIDLRPLSPLTRYDTRYSPPSVNYVNVEMNSPDPLHLQGTGFDFKVFPENLRIGISGAGLDVNGRLNVMSGYLDAFQIKLGEGGTAQMPVNYNITVAFNRGCRLKAGGLLEAVLSTSEVSLSGSPLSPRLSGRVRVDTGKLVFLSRNFALQPGAEVSFTPLFGANPHLKAEAEAIISQHPKAQTGAEPLIITASIDAFLLDIKEDSEGIKLTSNYASYSRNELLSILSYGEILEAFEQEGISSAFTSGLYYYPAGLISRYVRDIADFDRFELTLYPDDRFIIDLEKEMFFDNFILTYKQTFGEGTNYILGSKYRLRPRSYAGFRYQNLDSQDRQDWFYYLEYVMPIK